MGVFDDPVRDGNNAELGQTEIYDLQKDPGTGCFKNDCTRGGGIFPSKTKKKYPYQ